MKGHGAADWDFQSHFQAYIIAKAPQALVDIVTMGGDVCRRLAALTLIGGVGMSPDCEEILEGMEWVSHVFEHSQGLLYL
jgi:hypothetical protein